MQYQLNHNLTWLQRNHKYFNNGKIESAPYSYYIPTVIVTHKKNNINSNTKLPLVTTRKLILPAYILLNSE